MNGTEFEKMLEKEKENNKSSRKKQEYKYFVGTPNYMAVESVRNKGVSKATDSWALGCILYQLFVGFPPFIGGSEYLIFQKSIEAKYIFPKGIIDSQGMDLIQKLLKLDSGERLNIKEIHEHPFLSDTPKKYPIYHLYEIAFEQIKLALIKKYERDGRISMQIKEIDDSIRTQKEKIEESKVSEETKQSNNGDLETLEKFESTLVDLKKDFSILLKNFDDELKTNIDNITNCEYLEDNIKENILLRFQHLKKQVYHDIFNILFDFE